MHELPSVYGVNREVNVDTRRVAQEVKERESIPGHRLSVGNVYSYDRKTKDRSLSISSSLSNSGEFFRDGVWLCRED